MMKKATACKDLPRYIGEVRVCVFCVCVHLRLQRYWLPLQDSTEVQHATCGSKQKTLRKVSARLLTLPNCKALSLQFSAEKQKKTRKHKKTHTHTKAERKDYSTSACELNMQSSRRHDLWGYKGHTPRMQTQNSCINTYIHISSLCEKPPKLLFTLCILNATADNNTHSNNTDCSAAKKMKENHKQALQEATNTIRTTHQKQITNEECIMRRQYPLKRRGNKWAETRRRASWRHRKRSNNNNGGSDKVVKEYFCSATLLNILVWMDVVSLSLVCVCVCLYLHANDTSDAEKNRNRFYNRKRKGRSNKMSPLL